MQHLTSSAIAIAGPADRDAVTEILMAAFAHDPVARWFFAPDEIYAAAFPQLITALGGAALAHDAAYFSRDRSATALWLPPRATPDEPALVALLERSVPAERRETCFAVLEAMGRAHPTESHWYLPFIGVIPERQGHGLGTALLEASIHRCDEAGLPAYLESTNPRNVPLYRRFGFEVSGEIAIGGCPVLIPMIRPAGG
jgi:GNAT superfamily N-acetyltransferase